MKKDLHPKLEKLVVTYPDGDSIEMMSVTGGSLSVEISKSKHPAWTQLMVAQVSNKLTEAYEKWDI